MTLPAFSLVRDNDGLTQLAFAGRLAERDLLGFETELRVQLSAAPAHSLIVVIDLGAITELCHEGRDVLVRMHQFVMTRARHIVLVASQPSTRGVALWMMHMSGDRTARIAASAADAAIMATEAVAPSVPPPIQSHIRELGNADGNADAKRAASGS